MVKKARLFWAVNLPGELKERLVEVRRELLVPGLDAKWVEKENLHLTVVFLGDTDTNCINQMVAAVENSLRGMTPFTLEFAGPGFFPGSKNPKVLWLGVGGGLNNFRELHRRMQSALTPLGFPSESRPFSPHLTLARIRSPRECEALVRRVNCLPKIEISGVKVGSVDLMRSELLPKGPVYRTLAQVTLNSAGL